MILNAKRDGTKGILVDTGTGKRIPFAISANFEDGTYEHWVASADGRSILCADDAMKKPMRTSGKAVGKLVVVPLDQAEHLGAPAPPRVYSPIAPISQGEIKAGIDMYREVNVQVDQFRGLSRKCAESKFAEKLRKSSFLDHYIVGRSYATTDHRQRQPQTSPPGNSFLR